MPAVVRVKRKMDEEPLSAFVLNGKKRRTDAVADDVSTVLKFAGTLQEQDDDATTQLVRLSKDKAKQLVQQKAGKVVNVTERARQEVRQTQAESRFRIVNCMRTTLEEAENNAKNITIVDIEKQNGVEKSKDDNDAGTSNTASTSNAALRQFDMAQSTDSDSGFVYDVYASEDMQEQISVDLWDTDDNYLRYLTVYPYDNFACGEVYNNDEDNDEHDSDDSNHEDYVGNDYPDEDYELGDYDLSTDEDDDEGIARGIARIDFSHAPYDDSFNVVYGVEDDGAYGYSYTSLDNMVDEFVDADDEPRVQFLLKEHRKNMQQSYQPNVNVRWDLEESRTSDDYDKAVEEKKEAEAETLKDCKAEVNVDKVDDKMIVKDEDCKLVYKGDNI